MIKSYKIFKNRLTHDCIFHKLQFSCAFVGQQQILIGFKPCFCMSLFEVKHITTRPLTMSACRCGLLKPKDLCHLEMCVEFMTSEQVTSELNRTSVLQKPIFTS